MIDQIFNSHGLISVGCLALSRRVDPKWSDYQVKLSMLHYSKAMKSLTRIGQVPPVEIVLVACLLFITLEDYRSRREVSLSPILSLLPSSVLSASLSRSHSYITLSENLVSLFLYDH